MFVPVRAVCGDLRLPTIAARTLYATVAQESDQGFVHSGWHLT